MQPADTSANQDQLDTDLDALGDVCDPDDDGDGTPDVDDCAPLDPNTATGPGEVTGLFVENSGLDALVSWNVEPTANRYDLAGGFMLDLAVTGDTSLATCLADDLSGTSWIDTRAAPSSGDAYYYVARGEEVCTGSYGIGQGGTARLMPVACP